MKKINLTDFASEIGQLSIQYQKAFDRVLDSGWFILGEEVKKFENQFASYLGSKYCIGVANGLEALQISLMAAGISKEDEVITTPISAVATTLAILAVGAKPVFIDTDINGLMDPDLIQEAITEKTKVVLPVHLYGQAVNLKKIQSICKENNLLLIEDACQAHGSTLNGKKLGTFGDLGCFSFYPTKNLGGFGDGGAIVTNNFKLAKACLKIRDYGQSKKYYHTEYGLNSRLDELQAAFLSIKLKKLHQSNKKRQLLAGRYIKNLKKIGINFLNPLPGVISNHHLFVIKTYERDKLQTFLLNYGIQTDIHYPMIIPDQPFIKKIYGSTDLPNSRKFVDEIVSLPIHPYLEVDDIDFVCTTIADFFKKKTPKITVRSYRSIPEKYLKKVEKLKKDVYQNEYNLSEEQLKEHREKFCSQKDIRKYLLAFDKEEVVGGLKVMKRTIDFHGKKVVLGGLAGVWVKTDRQKQGIGLKIIKKAMEIMMDEGCDIAYLRADLKKLGAFYALVNFKPLNKGYTFLSALDRRFNDNDGMIAPILSEKLFNQILRDKNLLDIGKGNW